MSHTFSYIIPYAIHLPILSINPYECLRRRSCISDTLHCCWKLDGERAIEIPQQNGFEVDILPKKKVLFFAFPETPCLNISCFLPVVLLPSRYGVSCQCSGETSWHQLQMQEMFLLVPRSLFQTWHFPTNPPDDSHARSKMRLRPPHLSTNFHHFWWLGFVLSLDILA